VIEDRPLLGEGVLGDDQVGGDPLDLGAEGVDLEVELRDDAAGRLDLVLDVGQLAREGVNAAAQPFHLLLQVLALAANLDEALAAALEAGVLGRGLLGE
jgi:hypothetical protein